MRSLVVAVLLAGSIVSASAQQAHDTLRIRLNADIRSLDPGTNRDGNTDVIQAHLYEGLVAFKEDASVGPMLAKSIDVSPDGRTYTFVLRDGVTFSNGEPLTSGDVLFAWKRYTDPATGWRCLSEVDGRGAVKVTSVVAMDAQTVAFTLEKPSALFLATLARPDCGQTGIYHKSSLGPDGKFASAGDDGAVPARRVAARSIHRAPAQRTLFGVARHPRRSDRKQKRRCAESALRDHS